MDLSNVISLVKGGAPMLASALGSPLAGIALSLIANAFNVKVNDIDAILDRLKNDPDSDVKIKELELQHETDLQKIASQNFSLEVDDRKDARANSTDNKTFLKAMAYIMTAGLFGFMILLVVYPQFEKVSDFQTNTLSMIIGMIATQWKSIMSFFFGGKDD